MKPAAMAGATGNVPLGHRRALQRAFVCLCWLVSLAAALVPGDCSPAPQDPAPSQPQDQPQSQSQEQNSPQPTAFAPVHGVVRNAVTGQPLPRVLVRIEGDADAGALTDGEGGFEFPAVPVGPQTFRLLKPGFRDRPYATEDVAYQSDGPAHSVLVAAQMPELNFYLAPTCSIHGHVDLSNGDPAQGITVVLVKQSIRNGRAVWAQNAATTTNGDGAYRFASLPDGVYVVYTQPALESELAAATVAQGNAANVARGGYRGVFYPDAHDFAGAARIRLADGDQAQADLSLTVEKFHTVMAIPYFSSGGQFVPNSPAASGFDASQSAASILDASGHRLPYLAQFDTESQSIQSSLPDGAYTLLVSVATNEPAAQMQANANSKPGGLVGFVGFSVAGHAVVNLRIPLRLNPSWPVRIHAERSAMGSRQPAGQGLQGQGIQSMVSVTTTDADELEADVVATAEPLAPNLLDLSSAGFGPVWISTLVNDRSLCVASFTAGGINLAREPLDLSLAAGPPLMDLTLRDDCATLALELPPALSEFVPGEEPFYTVYVVPDFDTTVDIPPMNVHPSSGATHTLDGLTPGNYHVYVSNSPVRLEYRNPAALAALRRPGQAVMLSPGTVTNLMLVVP